MLGTGGFGWDSWDIFVRCLVVACAGNGIG